ncbi:MAG: GlxA family transcriptional regulator [Anaerolineae bacterium]
MTFNITLLAFDQCYTSGVTTMLDVFHVANRLWQRRQPGAGPIFDWRVVSPDGEPVTTTSRLLLPVDGSINSVGSTDMLIIPGSDFQNTKSYLALNTKLSQQCGRQIRKLRAENTIITACCGGPFLLASCGAIQDEPVTIAWWLADLFERTFPDISLQVDQLLIDQNNLITGGAAAYLDMGLYIVEKQADRFLMLECARLLLADSNRSSQMPYIYLQQQIQHSDDLVLQAQQFFRSNIGREFSLDEVAHGLNVSQRTLIRRFKQALKQRPIEYLQDLRIETAKRLLETSGMPLDEIIGHVGYRDISSFRRLFKQRTDLTPRQYRQRFGQSTPMKAI